MDESCLQAGQRLTILRVTKVSKILNLLTPHGFFQAQNTPKPGAYDASIPPSRLGRDTSSPFPSPQRLRRLACGQVLLYSELFRPYENQCC